jgi:hypothetical protein
VREPVLLNDLVQCDKVWLATKHSLCMYLCWPHRAYGCHDSGFGEGSPERKAAIILQHFFNYIAVTVVLAQLEVAFLPFGMAVPFYQPALPLTL